MAAKNRLTSKTVALPQGEGWGEGDSQKARLAETPPHPALRADLSPQAGRGEMKNPHLAFQQTYISSSL